MQIIHIWPLFLIAQLLCVVILWMTSDYLSSENIYKYHKFRKVVAIYSLATPISMWISPLLLLGTVIYVLVIGIINCVEIIREEW